MPSPRIEIAVTGVQNRKILSGLLLSRLAAKNKAKNKTARIQNKGEKKLSRKPPTTAARPVALELLMPRSAKNSPGPSSPTNTAASALSVPRRIVIGSPHGIATVGILLRESGFLWIAVAKSPFHSSSDSRGGNEWYRESAKGKGEDVLGDSASNTDPGVFVCKAYNQSSRSPRSSARDLVGLHTLAFGYWCERIEADEFKVARDPTVDKSPSLTMSAVSSPF
jgi:hypothetical protein